jgi:hypothetical protein
LRSGTAAGFHQRADVADRADVDLAPGQEGDGAAEIDGEAALHSAEDHASTRLPASNSFSSLSHGGFAARAVARQHRFAGRILDPVDIDLDLIADLELGLLARSCELAQRDAALRLQADVDHGHVVLDAVTVPFTTLPSKASFSPPRLSLRSPRNRRGSGRSWSP